MISICSRCGGMQTPTNTAPSSIPITTVEAYTLRAWCSCSTSVPSLAPLSYDEVLLTIEMLHDLLPRRDVPALGLIEQTDVQDLLRRVERMTEPLKEMVQALEVDAAVKKAVPALRRLAQEARSAETVEGGFAVE